MKIEDLGPSDADHSTGLVLHWRQYLLFALEDRRNWRGQDGTQIAKLIGIGGHVEAGETWAQAVRREAQEEAGLDVTLLQPDRTILFCDSDHPQDITAELSEPPPHPLFIWSTIFHFGWPPRERAPHFVNPVFLATVPDGVEPNPGAEVPGILGITEAQLHRMVRRLYPLSALLADGAQLWTQQDIPATTLIEPAGSAQWYEIFLGNNNKI